MASYQLSLPVHSSKDNSLLHCYSVQLLRDPATARMYKFPFAATFVLLSLAKLVPAQSTVFGSDNIEGTYPLQLKI